MSASDVGLRLHYIRAALDGHKRRVGVFGGRGRHYRARCDCGWSGFLRGSRARANRDFAVHIKAAA